MAKKLKIYDSEEEMNAATEDPLPGQDDPPPAVKLEAFVREHTGTTIRNLNAFQAVNVLKKAAPEEREKIKAGIIEARPELGSVFDAPTHDNPVKPFRFNKAAAIKEHASELLKEAANKIAPPPPAAPAPAEETHKVYVDAATLKLDRLVESPTNPRKRFDDAAIAELAQSVKAIGILQPLLVRPSNQGSTFEVVCGARRLRAAKLAGLERVPVIIRELSDLAVLECQIVENVQRQDVTALEEADAYHQLHTTHGYSVDQIAEKVGKTKSTVFARLKLIALCKRGRELLEAGKLPATHALLIARIPGEKLQNKAIDDLLGGGQFDEAPSFRHFAEELGRRFTLDLKSAPFDPEDDLLVVEAGACKKCPMRSGNCRELTPDIKNADVCTSPDCFASKVKAHADAEVLRLDAKGIQVLAKADAKKLFGYGDDIQWNADFVQVDKPNPNDQKRRTWSQLLEKAEKKDGVEPVPRRAVVAPSGRVLIVVDRRDAEKALKKLEGSAVAKKVAEDENAKEERKKEDAAREVRDRVALEVGKLAAERARKKGLELPVLRILMDRTSLDLLTQNDELDDLAIKMAGAKDAGDFEKRITTKVEAPDLCALLTLTALSAAGGFENHGGYAEAVKQFAKLLGVDLRALEKDAKALVQIADEVEKAEKKKASKSA